MDVETLYFPTCWTARSLSPEEILKYHLDFIENASKEVINSIPCQLNVKYGNLNEEKLDIYGTDLDDAPILVFVHGGYWQIKAITRKSYAFIALPFYKKGIKTIFVGYEKCPDVTLFEIVQEVEHSARKCIDYAKQHNSKGLFFCGHSAGAHLVTSLFGKFIASVPDEDQQLIRGVVPISGVFDLVPLLKTTVNDPLRLDEIEAAVLSPLKQEIRGGAGTEFHVIVGANESPEFLRQTRQLYDKLVGLLFGAHILVVDDVDHFDIIERLSDDDFALTKYLVHVILRNQINKGL